MCVFFVVNGVYLEALMIEVKHSIKMSVFYNVLFILKIKDQDMNFGMHLLQVLLAELRRLSPLPQSEGRRV
jgi:hypothetical protein